jgi:cytochrome c553
MLPRLLKLLMLMGLSVYSGASLADTRPEPSLPVYLGSALAKQPNETRGQKLFQQYCVQCHQVGALGRPAQNIPSLAGQRYEYLIKQVVDFLDQERVNPTMHQQLVRSGLNNATSIADVVGYVANLPMNAAPQYGAGQHLEQGQQIYEGFCASCHGRGAEGNSDWWVPNLRGQHYGYLLEQMRRVAGAQRANVSDDLHRMFTTYTESEFQSVADYLARWRSE